MCPPAWSWLEHVSMFDAIALLHESAHAGSYILMPMPTRAPAAPDVNARHIDAIAEVNFILTTVLRG